MADAFSLPGPYQQQYNEIARRQKMAEMLQAQAFAPDTAAPSYNGIPVPVSAFSGLSKALAGIGGGYLQNKAIEEQKKLGEEYKTETNSLIGQLSGTPPKAGTPEYTYKPEAADVADWEANPANVGKPYPTNDTGMGVQPAIPGTPAVPQTPSQRQQTLMALSNMGGPGGALGQSLLSKDIEQDYNAKALEAIFNPPGAPPSVSPSGTPPSVLAKALESTGTPTGTPSGAPTGTPIATATTPVAPSTANPTPPAFTAPPIMVNGKVVDQKAVLALMLRGGTLADIGKLLNTNMNEARKVAATIRGQDLTVATANRGQDMTAQTAANALADQGRRWKELTADQKAQALKDLAEGIAKYGEGYRLIADPDGKIGGIVPSRLTPSEPSSSLASEKTALELKDKLKIEASAAEIARANAADLKNLSRIPDAETQLKYVSDIINNPVMGTLVGKSLQIVESFVPGTEGYGFRNLVDSIKSGAFLKSYQESLKGGGSITEIEGTKGTQAINRMSIASDVKDFMKAAKDYTDVIERSMGQHKLEAMPREERNKFIADETKATKDQLAKSLELLRAQSGSNKTFTIEGKQYDEPQLKEYYSKYFRTTLGRDM